MRVKALVSHRLRNDPAFVWEEIRDNERTNMVYNEHLDRRALEKAVDSFAFRMKRKLRDKIKEGYWGWSKEDSLPIIKARLEKHVKRLLDGDATSAIDVANLAMFMGLLMESESKRKIE